MNARSPLAWAGVCAWGAVFGVLLPLTAVWPEGPVASVLGFGLAFSLLAGAVVVGSLGAAVSGWRRPAVLLGLALAAAAAAGGRQLEGAPSALLVGAALLAGGCWLGAALGRGVQEAAHLWPLVIVGVGADIWSVTTPEGITNQVVVEGEGPPGILQLLVLSIPVPGVGVHPVLGIGDVLFSGLLLGAAFGLGLSLRRCALGLVAGYGLTLAALLAVQLPLPALPFIAVSAVAALGRSAAPRTGELLLAGGFLLLLFGGRALLW